MTSRHKSAGYTAVAVIGLFVGAASIAAAAGSSSDPAPESPASQTDEADDGGVNCEDGIDSATGDECDGGPAAAQADEATEAPGDENEADEADDGVDHQYEGEEVGENGNGIADTNDSEKRDD